MVVLHTKAVTFFRFGYKKSAWVDSILPLGKTRNTWRRRGVLLPGHRHSKAYQHIHQPFKRAHMSSNAQLMSQAWTVVMLLKPTHNNSMSCVCYCCGTDEFQFRWTLKGVNRVLFVRLLCDIC